MHDLRRNYQLGTLRRDQLADDPIDQFRAWLEDLKSCEVPEWFETNAMTLSTVDGSGHVTSRIVLLKAVSADGFAFFTNYRSLKARQLEENSRAALNFYWPMAERQVRIEGVVTKTASEVSDGYFESRPFSSRLAAIVSPQSQSIDDGLFLEKEVELLATKYSDQKVPRPDYWGGYRLAPDRVEFWQGKPSRLHDRFAYSRAQSGWLVERIAP